MPINKLDNKYFSQVFNILRKKYKSDFFIDANTKDPFRILISCILSLRTKDEVTLPATERLFSEIKTPAELIQLSNKKVEQLIYPVGFYKRKAVTIKDISKTLINKFNSKVPKTQKELLSIKGVGLKTANLVLSKAYDLPAICVDTHVHRISHRLGWVQTKTPDETEAALSKILPQKYWQDINYMFVMHGKETCKPRGQKCSNCDINKYCEYYENIF